ncbi:MAG: hypothetical protein Q8L51_03795 [Candidatus Amesbacteria bacterium]|nr:hypothetical protein [Candidatus Amesbacteria bacterium]
MDYPDSLVELHKKYVRHTPEKAIVADVTILLAYLPKILIKGGLFTNQKVHINTRVIKHMYDKKPSEELDAILANLSKIVSQVEEIYQNLKAKRGDICLLGKIKGIKYICSIETSETGNSVVTCFRLRDENYLKKYKILWSRKGGIPSS